MGRRENETNGNGRKIERETFIKASKCKWETAIDMEDLNAVGETFWNLLTDLGFHQPEG